MSALARLRFVASAADLARSDHPESRWEPGPDGTLDLLLPIDHPDVERVALSYGAAVEVVAPQALRRSVAAHHRRASVAYVEPRPRELSVRQGDLFWATLPRHPATPALPHPHLVLQDDALNASRVDTVVVCALTSNVRRANEPANVLLDPGEGDLPQRSVIVVSQVASVPWSALGPHIGRLSPSRVQEVFQGLRLLASLTG